MSSRRLVLFALDSADPGLVEQWAAEGCLPVIADLARRGCRARLGGPEVVSEHGIWASLLSGVSRARHGYYHWRRLKPGTYDLELQDLRELSDLPFWSAFRRSGRRALILDPPETAPMADLPGIQLINWAPHNPRVPTSSEPSELLGDIEKYVGRLRPVEETRDAGPRRDRAIYRGLLDQIERKGRLCRYLLTREDPDLMVVGFFECHIAAHQLWRHHADGGGGTPDLRHALRSVYAAIDRVIGEVLAAVPFDADVAILSNAGVVEDSPSGGLGEAFCRALGYQAGGGPADASGRAPLSLARRLLPEGLRAALAQRLPRHTREGLLADSFRHGTDWRATTLFAIPSFFTGFLRVNLRGREPQGAVAPGTAYESLLDRAEADLRLLIDERTGKAAVASVERASALFGNGPPLALPDLFVRWQPAPHHERRVVHPSAALSPRNLDFLRETHHSPSGFLIAAGPRTATSSDVGEVDVLDLAPTFLSQLGEPVPPDLSGRPVDAVLGR